MSWRDRKGFLGALHNIVDAIRSPSSYAPPPIEPPPPPSERVGPSFSGSFSYVSRGDLPEEWGRNEAALWQDATRFDFRLANDEIAQMYYDAALYTFSDSAEDRRDAIAEFKQYIEDNYDLDWDDIFDWEEYRANYDSVAG